MIQFIDLRKASIVIVLIFFSISAFAQQTTISGSIKDESGEPLTGVNIVVKGKVIGTISGLDGSFSLTVNDAPPMTLSISMIGFATQLIEITEASTPALTITMAEQAIMGQEIVISASRMEESIMESPVSIEKMDILSVRNTSADNYYKGIANLKGVDVATSSINFQIINARGFGSTGNTRFVQLMDGMDTQAPALNFPIGNLNGPSELDVESVELIPGAASALYGPNAFNGILLITSKSPFDYPGLSAFVKTGVNQVGSEADVATAQPLYEGSIRYAKTFNNKFAFKLNASYMQAHDWVGTDYRDRETVRTPSGFSFNPGPDLMHKMGDEASINLAIFPLSSSWRVLASAGNGIFEPGITAEQYALAGDLPSHVVSVTPYEERDLIDYGAKNIKFNGALHYRINDNLELSYQYNYGAGTSIYTGAQRYSLSNFSIYQHRLELKGSNFYLRAYQTTENSGDSYITEFLAKRMIDYAFDNGGPGGASRWLGEYGVNYLRYLYDQGLAPGEINTLPDAQKIPLQESAHLYAKGTLDSDPRNLIPGTPAYEQAKEQALEGVVPNGPKFNDNSFMNQADFQYDASKKVGALDGLLFGGSYRQFSLNSGGTIFPDEDGGININEYGAYVQVAKYVSNEKLRFLGSLRYDKNQNFDGQVNPRISLVYKVAQNHNLRTSFQTGFRNPTTQGQFIDLNIITSRLLGGLEASVGPYNITENSYTMSSVMAYSNAVFEGGATPTAIVNNVGLLVPFTEFNEVKPEQIKSVEIGYKGLINNSLMIDFAFYRNSYTDFITQNQVRKAAGDVIANPSLGATLLNGTSDNTFSYYTNFDQQVTTQGAALGLSYQTLRGYTLGGNYSWNKLNEDLTAQGFLSEYNTPEHKFNISFSNRAITDNIGFNITYRWQEEFLWESSFARGFIVPSFSTFDAQVSYKIDPIKSILKIGGSNILNTKYQQSAGGPGIMGLYYVSLTFDEFMN